MQSKLLRTKTRMTTLFFLLSLFFVSVQQIIAQTTADLSLFQKVNTTRPVVGQQVIYTMTVKNFSSSTNVTAAGVQVKLPVGALEYVSVSPTTASFSFTTSTGIGQWTIPTIAANDSVTLTLTARVLTQGVHYVISEISNSSNPDPDSTPLNTRLGEDDLAVSCVSVPLTFNTGDVFVVGIDPAFASPGPITWLKDNQPITASTTGASVDANGILTIRSIGEYTFVTTIGACPAGGCCPISVVLGNCTDFVTVSSVKPSICVGETAALIGTATNGSSINWYLTPTGGSPVATTASGAVFNASPSTTTVYYAELVNKPAECTSARQAFTVTVNAIPSTPSCPPTLDICSGDRVNLLQNILNPVSTTGGSFQWRVGISPTSALVATPTSVGAGTYYLFETSTAGCVSNPAILVVTEKSCTSTIDLSLIKTADKTVANVNDLITYTITLRNDGATTATNIEVEDILPTQIQFVSSSQFVALSTTRLRATVASLGVGQTATFTYVARATSVGSPINFVQVTRVDQRDSDSTPNNGPTIKEDDDAAFLVTVVQQPTGLADLSLTTTVNFSNPALNTTVTYLITVRNDGPSDATGVFIRDILPTGVVFIGSTGATSVEQSVQRLDFGLGTIPAGTVKTIQILAGVGATGVLTNYTEVLRVNQNDPDSTPGNQSTTEDDDDTVSITVGGGTTCNIGQLLISCSNPFICPGQSTTLTASGSCAGTITWSNGQTGATITVTPSITTIYTASCVVSPICVGALSNPISIVVSNPLAPTIQANRTMLCDPTDVAILTASNCAGIITWSNGQLGSSIQVSPQTTTNYTATCKVGGCESGISNTITITRGVRPNAPTLAATKTTACANESITLTATNCTGVINWSTGQTGASITVSSTTTRTYTATCTVGSCISTASNAVTITITEPFPITIVSTADEICAGTAATLTANGCTGGSISWSTGQTGASIQVSPTVTTTYTATCTVGVCTSSATKQIIVKPTPTAPLIQAAKNTLCVGETIVLSATNCTGTVTWSTGATGNTLSVSPTVVTTYSATCTINGCVSPSSTPITLTPVRPAVQIAAAKTTACANENIVLTATNCTGVVNWSTGQTGASITVSSTTTRTYTATCTVGSCISTASNAVTITITEPFPITIVSTADEICAGTAATLTANGCTGGTIRWSTGQTGASIQVSPLILTTYTATCTVGVCTSSATKQIIVKPTPTAPLIQAEKNTLCVGETIVLSATNCTGTVTWSTGATGNTLSVSPTVVTTYSAICTINGCVSPSSTPITLTPVRPAVQIVSSKPTICIGETVTLVASGCEGTLRWNTGATTGSITVSPASTTTYTVSCTLSGCTAEASTVIQVTPPIAAPVITSSKENVCTGESIILTAANCAGTIRWSTGQTGASVQVSPTTSTTYTATCTVNSCTNTAQKVITVQPLPSPPFVSCGCGSERICAGDEVVFTANNCAGTVTWSTGFVGNIMAVKPTVTTAYSATCTVNGCTSPSTTPVTIQILTPSPKIVVSSEVICGADSVTLTATNCAGTIRWSTGSLEVSIRVKPAVTSSYTLSCTVEGCIGTDTKQILVATGTPPVISATSTSICAGSILTLSATSCAGEVVWSTGQTGATITVSPTATTTYTAQCRATNSCLSAISNGITVSVTSQPTAPTLNITNATVCSGDQVNLTATGCNGLITWSTGETGASIVVRPTTNTVVSATCKIGSCESTATNATLNVGAPAAPTITASSTVVCVGSSITLTASNCAGTVRWSDGQTGASIIVSPTSQTSYTAICATTTCQSTPSNSITLTISAAIAKPSVRDIKNICPATTANLTTALTSTPSSPNGSFVYLTGAQPNSPAVSSVTSVGAGTYFIFERATTGCLSEGSRVVVAIDECTITTDTAKADIAVAITASSIAPSIGDTLTYTIRVTNNGPGIARIIDVLSTIPSGSGTVIGLDGLTLAGNNLSARILNLPKDSSRVFRFQVVHLAQLPVVQEAVVTLVSQTDPILSNNRASVTVSCATCSVISLGSALAITDTTRVGNDCVDITYQALLKNRGTVLLTNVGLVDSLQKSFALPATFTVVKAPTLNAGSNLVINTSFNGGSDARLLFPTGSLAVGRTDTIRYTVRVCPGNLKEFLTQTIATATGTPSSGISQSVQVRSNVGFNPDAVGTNPTPLTITNDVNPPVNTACIGLALSAQTERLPNNISVVTYKAIIKNCGIESLSNVQLCDTLSTTFKSPAVASILQKPSVNAGSQLRADTTFNGFDKSCMLLPSSTLAPGKVDTVTWKVRIVENGSTGPFVNNILVTARNVLSELVQDVSNDGVDPNPVGSIPTVVNLTTLPNALIGLSKELGEVNKLDSAGTRFSINFNFYLKNYGTTEIRNVQLEDNLAEVFGDNVLIEQTSITADNGLTVNTAFTGKGNLIELLVDSTSVLPGQSTRVVRLNVRIDRGTSNQSIFSNTALVSGIVGTTTVDDVSTDGINPDPDIDGNPRNNSTPTQFDLGEPLLPEFNTKLGIAKQAVLNPIRNVDGSFDVTYNVVVKNYGTVPMRAVQLADDLVATFGNTANFSLFVKPLVRTGSTLVANKAFDGVNDTNLLVADSSSLATNASDTLRFIVKVRNFTTSNVTYRNLIVGAAIADTLVLTDLSFAGLDPDPDGDGNPGNNNLATPITIEASNTNPGGVVIVSDAMSPNGDLINDELIITGITESDELRVRIYTRWGQLVFESDNYRRDFPDPNTGWNGVANRGLFFSTGGVPDGTYYYSIESPVQSVLNGEIRFNFITIAR